jgi:hypothetical protein
MTESFSLEPVNQADMDDLAARGIEWIKGRLERATLYIPNVRDIKALAESEALSAEDYHVLLAYRVLVDLVRITTRQAQSAQHSASQPIVPNSGIILP